MTVFTFHKYDIMQICSRPFYLKTLHKIFLVAHYLILFLKQTNWTHVPVSQRPGSTRLIMFENLIPELWNAA